MGLQSRDTACRSCEVVFAPPTERRAQGMPGARCTRGLVCNCAQRNAHTSIQVSGEHSDIPCAMALRLTSCSSRRRIPFCHRRLQISGSVCPVEQDLASAALTPATGARTTRLRRTQQNIRLWTAASITSRAQRVVTMAIRPSGERETVSYIVLICRNCKRKIYAPSWTTQSA